jgi:hypothetical protein
MTGRLIKRIAVLMLAVSIPLPAAYLGAETFEQPPLKLNAALIVPDELLVGDGYKIDTLVANDGYSNTYTLNTDWGEVQAISDYRLRARVQEVEALLALDSMSRAGVFGNAMKAGVLAPIEGAVALVTSPIETTTGAIKGIGRWFGNVARSITSDDPYQEGALSAAAGWAATKRAFAVELGVDPYTDWEPLQQALVSVGRAAFAGGITAEVAKGAATKDTKLQTPVVLLSMTKTMNQQLIDNPPALLAEINQKKLLDMGIDKEVVTGFSHNYNYTPYEKLLLVEALNRMSGAAGREIFLAQATAAPDKVVARYFQQRAEMMANYHTEVVETDIVEGANVPLQKTRDGHLIGAFPIDYLAWTADAATIAGAATEYVARSDEAGSAEFWFEGSVSQMARHKLEASGWTVKERVGLLTGQALQSLQGSDPATISPAVQ